ncbi:hypothetical protein G647_00380 [Cladophialophora carrionii CBS 160.54]|uniref:AAA+ ATPase domain-containing protein n=1 Tax=Cladophialophora carrionii CBS 160.54 TaxID=1279043 RepID=V9DMR2_9EURO|nr:uncharacterized protein G647_00380 [Cladophialophora carrionii CBS 160.54]ETI27931.1 hypothetical protein G647_00380 [Cladophialophora carrionii CBS 160.54]
MERIKYTLQETISITDSAWRYNIPNLPKAETCHQAGRIKAVTLICSSSDQGIYLRWSPTPKNRATREHRLEDLIQVSISDFRPVYDTRDPSLPATPKQTVDYLTRFLTAGIIINDIRYSFFGHSNSQLKSRSCYLLAGTKEEVGKKVEALGDFKKIKTVAKKAKRIGLLFSTTDVVQDVPASRCQDIDDVERDGFIFTDGCGLISKDFIRLLASKKPIIFRDRRYHPSVLQIRYRGYKGVVTLEPRIEKGLWLKLRKSMKKFSGTTDMSFAVVEYSKPYTYGYLNDEIVLLLHSLGVEAAVFIEKLRQYHDVLEQSRTDPRCAFRLLSSLGQASQAEKLLIEGMEQAESGIRKLLAQEYDKMVNKREEQKTRILIPRSRLLFGVCDPYGVLKPDECFVRVTLEQSGAPMTITGANVLISRNPCLHPGDLRKLKAVENPKLNHLVDCVVFSTQGKRPTADLMSGGDLDGDTFFVCWDPDLIPETLSEAAEYPGTKEAIRFSPITRDDLITYFAGYNNMSLGRVKKLYLGWARVSGPHSTQCQELNRLFSQCVDGNRIKIPDRLLDPPEASPATGPFILDTLHELALEHCQRVKAAVAPTTVARQRVSDIEVLGSADRNMMEFILTSPTPFSDFELAQLTLAWCRKNRVPFEEFWTFFDSTKLAADEQAWILSELPPSAEYASFMKNGLLQSNILTSEDLRAFRLDYQSLHWKCVFDSVSDPLRKLMAVVGQTFHQFAKKLLVLRLSERLSIAIYFPRPIEKDEDNVVHDTVRLFAFPHSHKDKAGHRRAVPTKKNYRFYYDETVMQLYETHRSNSFVFFTKSANDDSAYRNVEGTGNKARARQKTIEDGINCDWRVSIALGKFSSQLATHIGRTNREPVTDAELYVISNRDVRALRALDLWLESIDTLNVLSNFPDGQPTDSLPSLTDVDWNQHSDFLDRVVRRKEFAIVLEATIPQLLELLQFCYMYDVVDIVSEVYRRLLGSIAEGDQDKRCSPDHVSQLIEFLHYKPSMAVYLARLCPWSLLPIPYIAILQREVFTILRALVLSGNRMGELVLGHISAILREDICLGLAAARSLLETASMAITNPDLLLTILMESRDAVAHTIKDHDSHTVAYFLRNMFGIVLDHCAEANESNLSKSGSWLLVPVKGSSGNVSMLRSQRRIDAPRLSRLAVGDHVRFVAKKEPPNSRATQPTTLDVLVEAASDNEVKFECLWQPPIWVDKTAFEMKCCVPFVGAKAMAEALVALFPTGDTSCGIAQILLNPMIGWTSMTQTRPVIYEQTVELVEGLNESQSRAVVVSTSSPLTCLWGPPGTGKTTTIIALLRRLLKLNQPGRILVTAPTHNAVDNVLRQYVKKALKADSTLAQPLRVSTEVCVLLCILTNLTSFLQLMKVADDLKEYTCDAMFGKDLNQHPAVRRKAVARISESKLVFTTCVGAALGLLRNQSFETVIIDEASQQTEPASLIPLVKGCQRSILVGDHVQLRATVSPHAAVVDFDVSLMERLWLGAANTADGAIATAMLDTQYRMHPSLCQFPSAEFYDGRLLTASGCDSIQPPPSCFPWPKSPPNVRGEPNRSRRAVFIQCHDPEDYGKKSKVNQTQAKICKETLQLLTTMPAVTQAAEGKKQPEPQIPSIAILTPYSRQADLLKQLCGGFTVSSIDGFQGQEADIVIFVTVRCNLQGEIGFLKDMRRLNVALTRAKAGLIIIGDQTTLTMKKEHEEACKVWDRLIRSCARVDLPAVVPQR